MAISGLVNPFQTNHSTELLGELCRILKPSGQLYAQELAVPSGQSENGVKSIDKLVSLLKLSGFVDIVQVSYLKKIKIKNLKGV